MDSTRTFTNIDDSALIDSISSANSKVIYISPGISKKVALILSQKINSLPKGAVNIILDVDPEVCRLGYGELDGLEIINKALNDKGLDLHHQAGLRIGVLLTENKTIIFTPTPLLVESESKSPEKPNGISLSNSENSAIEKAIGSISVAGNENLEIGKIKVNDSDITSIQQDLELNPPKKFDLARVERVFNSRIQYVEFSLEDYKLSKKTVPIPTRLIGISDNKDLTDRWRNSFRLFDGSSQFAIEVPKPGKGEQKEKITEKGLEKEKKDILDEFIINVPNFGNVLLRVRRDAFEKRVKEFKEYVELFKKGVCEKIEEALKNTKDNLIKELLPLVVEKPPAHWKKTMVDNKLSEDEARERLNEELNSLFCSVDKVFNPTVKVIFKDVSYETIHNTDFLNHLKMHFPEAAYRRLFNEYDAAPETGKDKKAQLKLFGN